MNCFGIKITKSVMMAGFLLTVSYLVTRAQGHFNPSSTADLPTNAISTNNILTFKDSTKLVKSLPLKEESTKKNWAKWRPNPKKALWLAIVLPGAGQIYNRKYWKLPIIYGGFVGCIYAMQWNNTMYRDYSQAYLDIMDNDPSTQSYNQFLHLGTQITSANTAQYQGIFKSRKDRYRRWRDLSFFCMLGVYALSIIDAYVDASLSEFDISDDLSLRVEPAVIGNTPERTLLKNSALGVHCSLRF